MDRKQLLFIGDSLIEFFDWQQRFPDHEVINLGVAGETVEGLQARLDHVIGTVIRPDMVFIMTGINNAAMEDYGFVATYEKVVARLKKSYPEAQIFINSLLPVRLPWFADSTIPRLNKRLGQVAAEKGAKYLDIYRLFSGSENQLLLEDGVHLSAEGYRAWSGAVANAIDRPSKQPSAPAN